MNLVRERFFTPRLRFKSYDELNGWLLDKCISYARAHKHVDQPQRTIWDELRRRSRRARLYQSVAGLYPKFAEGLGLRSNDCS